MKVLFIDHKFHTKTKSSNFFLQVLTAAVCTVDVEYVDAEETRRIAVLERPREHDIVVLWQLDFLAPVFLAAGYPTVVVPMYDGSANMPYEHWLAMAGASFVNFSRSLHERVSAVGARSFLARYYLKPHSERELPTFDELRAILWMRRPEDGLTPRFVEHIVGNDLVSLHVHNAPDSGTPLILRGSKYSTQRLAITESQWRSDSNPYVAALGKANLFIAPRLSEGIGMAMLEAFSRGLLILANDDAVHNEYVSNWTNGILFSRNSGPFHIPLQTAKDIAYVGWKGAALGYEEWQDIIPAMLRFIRETPAPQAGRPALSKADLVSYWDAYTLGIEAHRRSLLNHFVDPRSLEQRREVAAPVRAMLRESREGIFSLDEGTAYFGDSPNTPANKFGFGDSDALSAAVDAFSVGFDCACQPLGSEVETETLAIHGRLEHDADSDWLVLVHVDGRIASRTTLPRKAGDFQLEAQFIRSHDPLSFIVSFVDASAGARQARNVGEPPPVRFVACDLRGAMR